VSLAVLLGINACVPDPIIISGKDRIHTTIMDYRFTPDVWRSQLDKRSDWLSRTGVIESMAGSSRFALLHTRLAKLTAGVSTSLGELDQGTGFCSPFPTRLFQGNIKLF
jgi:hypothetical protein